MIVYVLVARDLDAALDRDLRLRAQDLSALVTHGSGALDAVGGVHLVETGESFAQLLDARGRVVDATPALRHEPLLPTAGGTSASAAPSSSMFRPCPDWTSRHGCWRRRSSGAG